VRTLCDNRLVARTGGRRDGLTRRGFLAGAAAGAGLAAGSGRALAARNALIRRTTFAEIAAGDGWGSGWRCPGAANLRIADGRGLLEAASDVFPNDPRPVCFAVDARVLEGSVRASITAPGSACGVVLRRRSPREYYAAVYDVERSELSILRRSGTELVTLSRTPAPIVVGELTLELSATSFSPTVLDATLTTADGREFRTSARDGHGSLQRPGDPGVMGQARTLFPSAGPPQFPALGNLHLLPYGIQEGQAVIESPGGQALVTEIRRQSTVSLREITISSTEVPARTRASVVAATTGLPRDRGARLHVASDLPARVVIEIAEGPEFKQPLRIAEKRTGRFDALTVDVSKLPLERRAYWRATLRRRGTKTVGPVRSFPILPAAGRSGRTRLAVGSCGVDFGPLFDDLARQKPDVFVWQGDLNYPDTHGPLAQTMSGYAGIWRDFLANPRLAPVLRRSAFVAMRDDHDYGAQDSNASTLGSHPWGVEPWDALFGAGAGYRFSAGPADVWVLDQRRFKTDPTAPDDGAKTLLGARQRSWLLRGLRSSTAPFKVICSPCTLLMPYNARDGNWAAGFTAERDRIFRTIDRKVTGRVVFVTGDTHLTGVYDQDDRYEARACPIGIPVPNDITISDPGAAERLRKTKGVTYADERCHYAVLDLDSSENAATLDISLRRDDGAVPYRKTFTEPIPRSEPG